MKTQLLRSCPTSRPHLAQKTSAPKQKSARRRRTRNSPSLGEKEICRIVGLRTRHPGIPVSGIREFYRKTYGNPLTEGVIKRILISCGMPEIPLRSAELGGGVFPDVKTDAPNDLWTVEFKSGWHNRSGLPEPIIVRDEVTRLVVAARMLPDSSVPTMGAFFDEIFRSNGFPQAICCPKSTPFGSASSLYGLTKLSARWLALGINLDWKSPGHTRESRWIERPRMLLGYAWQLQNAEQRQHELDRWREEFNKTTNVSLKNSSRPGFKPPHHSASDATPSLVQLEYPGLECRRVGKRGCFHFGGRTCFLSTALAGWDIALAPREDGQFDVRFARVSLGILDPEKVEFTPAIT